jgi:hypothetical protein
VKHTLIVAAQSKQDRPKGWRDVLPVHPAAELFPLMSEPELREHAADIKASKLQMPIAVWSSDPSSCGPLQRNFTEQTVPKNLSLLDGRNRLDALELNGIKLVTDGGKFNWLALYAKAVGGLVYVTDQDPYAYVISVNIHRRHLTSEQKRDLIAKLLKAKPETSNLQIAKQVKADDKTVAKVRTKLEATSEIPKLTKTVGKDGKSRPVRKKQAPEKPAGSLNESAPAPKEVGVKPSTPNKTDPTPINLPMLVSCWREVEAQATAENKTRLKAALQRLLKEVSAALARLRS